MTANASPPQAAMSGAMRVLSGLLEARTGQILSESRIWRIETALKPLLRAQSLDSLETLVSQLLSTSDPTLVEGVVNALLNNESSFFRDLQAFDMLSRDLLPHIARSRSEKSLRIWCAGCSTGQEAFSLAMLIRKRPELWDGWRVNILATDISTSVIARAQSGLFSQIDVQRGLAITDLLRWFEPVGDDWKASDDLRNLIEFRVDNILDPKVPSGYYDLILCRNVQLYFSAQKRREVFDHLAKYSRPDGLLLLGAGETVIGQTENFVSNREFRGSYVHSSDNAARRAAAAG
jgi:chemotaxis protein methyltransferase CheR